MRKPVLALVAAATLCACEEEQRLYSYKEEPSAAMATQPALPPGHPPMTAASAEAAMPARPEPPPADRVRLGPDAKTTRAVVQGVSFAIPEQWKETPSASAMRAAQYALPADGDGRADGEVVFFHFGPPPAGGSAEENVKRWIGQVEPSFPPVVYRYEHDGLTIHEVIVEGTLKPSGMGMGPTEPRPDSGLYGVVVEGGPKGALFVKATGSRSAIDAAKPALATMAETARAAEEGTEP